MVEVSSVGVGVESQSARFQPARYVVCVCVRV